MHNWASTTNDRGHEERADSRIQRSSFGTRKESENRLGEAHEMKPFPATLDRVAGSKKPKNQSIMLKDKIIALLERYEQPNGEILTASDVRAELQTILDEDYDSDISDYLQEAIDRFAVTQMKYNRYGGGNDGSEDFIIEVESIIMPKGF